MHVPAPRLYLGTMTFGWSQTSSKCDEPVATEMMRRFIEFNKSIKPPSSSEKEEEEQKYVHYIDTARIYAGGKTETILGNILPSLLTKEEEEQQQHTLAIGSKAHPSQTNGLSSTGIRSQFQSSLASMNNNTSTLSEYYLHQPDTQTPLLESLRTLHEMRTQRQISAIGMSNYHVDEMERVFDLCRIHHLTPPTVYQGLYNPLNRMVERDLIPLLRRNGCSFVAYNPLAAGLLTGKHHRTGQKKQEKEEQQEEEVMKGRFRDNPNYLPRFYTESNFEAIDILQSACEEEEEGGGMSMVEATYRWLIRHSILDGSKGDGILLGASSVGQLDENLEACRKGIVGGGDDDDDGTLPQSILDAFDRAWKVTEEAGVFPYWRSYSADMPGREDRDQGASYSAVKKKK